jgi:hypothetical protein
MMSARRGSATSYDRPAFWGMSHSHCCPSPERLCAADLFPSIIVSSVQVCTGTARRTKLLVIKTVVFGAVLASALSGWPQRQ